MKYLLLFFLTIFISPLFSADLITVLSTQGKVEIKQPGESWSKAVEGQTIPEGSVISTGFKSSAELDLSGSSTVYIKQLTRMGVDKLAISGKQVNTKLNLKLGRIKADVKTSKGLRHNFTLKTPVSTAAVRGTVFESSVRKLEVVTGRISFTNKIGQKTTVDGGGSSSVGGTGFTPPATTAEIVTESFTVNPSTQPEGDIPEIIVLPAPTTGTVTLNWFVDPAVLE